MPTYDGGTLSDIVVNVPYVASYTPGGGGGGVRITIDMLVTGDVQFENPGNMGDGQQFILRLRSDASPHTVSFGGSYRGSSDTPLSSFTLPASATEYRAFRYNAASGKTDYLAFNKDFT